MLQSIWVAAKAAGCVGHARRFHSAGSNAAGRSVELPGDASPKQVAVEKRDGANALSPRQRTPELFPGRLHGGEDAHTSNDARYARSCSSFYIMPAFSELLGIAKSSASIRTSSIGLQLFTISACVCSRNTEQAAKVILQDHLKIFSCGGHVPSF